MREKENKGIGLPPTQPFNDLYRVSRQFEQLREKLAVPAKVFKALEWDFGKRLSQSFAALSPVPTKLVLLSQFVENCKLAGLVPHPILWSCLHEDFDPQDQEYISDALNRSWRDIRSELWQRRPEILMIDGREERWRQLLNGQRAKAYIAICRGAFPEIESMAREYVSSDEQFKETLRGLDKKARARAISRKISSVLGPKGSPIHSLYVDELGGLLGGSTLLILMRRSFESFWPDVEMQEPLPLNRHYHSHGLSFVPTYKDGLNSLFVCDIAMQAFSLLSHRVLLERDQAC